MGGYTDGRRPVGKPGGRLKDARPMWGDAVNLLKSRDWKVAPRKREGCSKKIG